jgi:hypothetical protein
MNHDGSGQDVQVIPNGPNAFSWSPDGTELAIPYGNDIYRVKADGSGEMENITNTPNTTESAPAWSSTDKIAFSSGSDIWVINASDGSDRTQLTDTPSGGSDSWRREDRPSWSPDGSQILYAGYDNEASNGDWDIFKINADGTGQQSVTDNTVDDHELSGSWSPDGTRISYSNVREGWEDTIPPKVDIHVIDANGANAQNITGDFTYTHDPSSTSLERYPSWSHERYPSWGPSPGSGTPTDTPKTKADCKKGGYKAFGFKNQGQCIKAVNAAS